MTANKQPTILCVEDDKIVQLVFKSKLTDLNCLVDIAETGQQGIELFQSKKYDLIFMDIGLPDMSGIEVTRKIRALELARDEERHTPIVASTAHIDEGNKKTCLNVGMQAVFTKPITDEQAHSILSEFIYQA